MNPPTQHKHSTTAILPILSAPQTRILEEAANASGVSYEEMMERAGTALAERVLARLNLDENNKVLFLIGPGNNGGDGLVAARVLRERAFTGVTAYLLRQRNDDLTTAAQEAGVKIINAQQDKDSQLLQQSSYSAAIIVDALYGIGLRLPLREEAVSLLRIIHSVRVDSNSGRPSIYEPTLPNPITNRPYIIAADCPSGLDVNSGEMDENILPANETVTFLTPKLGFFSKTAASAVGTLAIASLGISEELISSHSGAWQLAHAKLVRQLLPIRIDFSDKRSNGRLLIIAGCMKYIGAVALAARAAYRSGAGIVQIASPLSVRDHLPSQLLEAVWLPLPDKDVLSPESIPVVLETIASVDAIILGPGIGLANETGAFLAEMLKSNLPPLVLDADGLTLLSQLPDWPGRLPTSTVLTPHQREFSRLSGLAVDEIAAERWEVTEKYARDWGVTLLLKGAFTAIASPQQLTTVLPFKLDALATAGTGDVLSGIIGAFLASGCDTNSAAIAGGYVHALAGNIAQERQGSARSVIASDVTEALGAALAQLDSDSA